MYRPSDTQEKILHRLKISKGHLEKVIKMIEEDEYCIDVLHQSKAIQKALQETDNVILENHLKNCAADAFKRGEKDRAIQEVMSVVKKAKS